MTKLRVLVEMDGKVVADIDKEVQRVNMQVNTDVSDTGEPKTGFVVREPTGSHTINIFYKDKK